MKPRLLDLFCGGGGCAVGYHRAGFDVTGVDVKPQKRYPFAFHQEDALEYLQKHWREYDAVHASPPCQKFSTASFCMVGENKHPDLVTPIQKILYDLPIVWAIENVPRAPLSPFSLQLCGLMFGLKVFRHRIFECSDFLWTPEHPSHQGKRIGKGGFCTVAGGGNQGPRDRRNGKRIRYPAQDGKAEWERAMGIDWMSRDELAQAIPPAFTYYIGCQLRSVLDTISSCKPKPVQ